MQKWPSTHVLFNYPGRIDTGLYRSVYGNERINRAAEIYRSGGVKRMDEVFGLKQQNEQVISTGYGSNGVLNVAYKNYSDVTYRTPSQYYGEPYLVRSQKIKYDPITFTPNLYYVVEEISLTGYKCNCPDYLEHSMSTYEFRCKHILATEMYRGILNEDGTPAITDTTILNQFDTQEQQMFLQLMNQ